ncbi:serine/threonine protein kinase [Anncaliia algerae PRA339]|uniref:Serine/threonine protein kinase n=1 Tax=Anncaliia algerae PRA339 TaxID=1288291 RepID=A0A059F3T2_9MICR|nr:serine/threonine protein kinase [Anncaliia algerae PRA339]
MFIKNRRKIKNYEFITTIGEGRYSTVYKAKKDDEQIVAIKEVSKNSKLFNYLYVENERKNIKLIKPHENIIQHFEFLEDNESYYFVMEYIDGYSLRREITESIWSKNKEDLSFELKKSVILQTIEAVEFLHSCNIYHCDIKPENIVLFKDKIKVLDFGCSYYSPDRFISFSKGVINSTPGVGAPEIVFVDPEITVDMEKVDVWGLGFLIYFIFSGNTPFTSRNSTETFLEVKNLKVKYTCVPKCITDICRAIFIKDIGKRLNLKELRELIYNLTEEEFK